MQVYTHHHFSDNLYAKEIFVPRGFTIIQHQHDYDHLSVLAKGRVAVKTDEGVKEYKAPACLNIIKHFNHSIYALEDSVWFCIHSTDETDENKIDEVLVRKVD